MSAQEGKNSQSEDDPEDDLEDESEISTSKALETTFELNETLFAEAELEDTDTVFLWLGVRVFPWSRSINLTPMYHVGQRHVIIQDTRRHRTFALQARSSRE